LTSLDTRLTSSESNTTNNTSQLTSINSRITTDETNITTALNIGTTLLSSTNTWSGNNTFSNDITSPAYTITTGSYTQSLNQIGHVTSFTQSFTILTASTIDTNCSTATSLGEGIYLMTYQVQFIGSGCTFSDWTIGFSTVSTHINFPTSTQQSQISETLTGVKYSFKTGTYILRNFTNQIIYLGILVNTISSSLSYTANCYALRIA
jgi:hypothetical protein